MWAPRNGCLFLVACCVPKLIEVVLDTEVGKGIVIISANWRALSVIEEALGTIAFLYP